MAFMDGVDLLRFFAAFLVVLGLLWLFHYLGKRFLKAAPLQRLTSGKSMQVLEEMPLYQGRHLILMAVDQSKVLLLISPKGDQLQSIPGKEVT